ncbi:putative metal-dependent membrane protease [Salinarchaeum sp. Harcht-Bsk1]|nr:putative metal-dependent membrane protease [Salinarchaeum sp. Harcht-Bsk1]
MGFVLFLVLGLSWLTSGRIGRRDPRIEEWTQPERSEREEPSNDADGRPVEDDGRPSADEAPSEDVSSQTDGAPTGTASNDTASIGTASTERGEENEWGSTNRGAPPNDRSARNERPASTSEDDARAREPDARVTESDARTFEPDSGTTQSDSAGTEPDRAIETAAVRSGPADGDGLDSIPTAALLANVLLTHGGLGLLVLGAAALTGIPAATLGVDGSAWSTGALAVGGGLAFGGALAALNVALAASLDRIGVDYSEALRAALAPDSALGWGVLLLLILPLVAGFEELLFRAVLIGGAAAATGLSPWLFVVLSSIAFALGHGVQGKGGIAVTGLLGGVLGVAFVLTNSLVLVVIAHYVVNAVEFLLKEWLGWNLDGRL